MQSICLLHSDNAGFDAQRSAIQLAQGLRGEMRVLLRTIGRASAWRTVLAAARGLRRDAPGLTHAFDARSLLAAALGTRLPIAFTPPADDLRASIRLVRSILDYRSVHVICPTATMHRTCVERGIPLDRCHLIRPGVDFSRLKRRRDPELRARLGLSADEVVVLAPGESSHTADHHLAVWVVSILRVINPHFRMLLWGRGDALAKVKRLGYQLEHTHWVIDAQAALDRELEFEEILPAADLVLAPARQPVPTLALAICMAAQLPIVASATYTHSELLEDRHTALMVPEAIPRSLARRVLDLRDNAALAWQLADRSRVEAYEYHAQTRFLAQHRSLYDSLSRGVSVMVEPVAPGAGSRFHGRA